MGAFLLLAIAALLPAAPAGAHPLEATAAGAAAWRPEPWVLWLLALAALLYAVGVVRLWRQAGRGRGIAGRQAVAFGAGWLALAAALATPLDALGGQLFAAHMVQHELLMVVSAPLLVLGRPLAAWTWALPARGRRWLGPATRWSWFAVPWRWLTRPVAAWALHGVALWAWHVPPWFDAALHREGIHVLQHASFLVTALLFWWSVLGRDARSGRGGFALASLLTTMMHTGALGALLTFAPSAWYPAYAAAGAAFGLSPLEDQQLGGLIMWVPGSLAYLAAGLALAARLLGREDLTRASAARPALPRSGAP